MKVTIFDYMNNPKTVDIGALETIDYAFVDIISGDEILTIRYWGGKQKRIDSNLHRADSFEDCWYVLRSEDIKMWNKFLVKPIEEHHLPLVTYSYIRRELYKNKCEDKEQEIIGWRSTYSPK